MGLIIFKNGNTQTATDPAYLLLQIKQMSPHPTPSLVAGFRTNRGISQNQNPMQNSLEFRAWTLFPGLSSIKHYSYVSINPSLDKKRRKTKKKSEEEILALSEGSRPALPWVSIPAAPHFPPWPGPSRFVLCRRITAGTGRSSLIHCLFGRERRVESEGKRE